MSAPVHALADINRGVGSYFYATVGVIGVLGSGESMRYVSYIGCIVVGAVFVACSDKDQDTGANDVGANDVGGDEAGGDEAGGGEGTDGGDCLAGDAYAQTACSLLSGGLTSIQAASSVSEAAQALLVPSDAEAWSVTSGGTDSYLMVEVEDWMVTVRVFATEDFAITLEGVGEIASQSANEACDGVTDQAYEVHEWGSYVLHVQGEGDFELSVIQEDTES